MLSFMRLLPKPFQRQKQQSTRLLVMMMMMMIIIIIIINVKGLLCGSMQDWRTVLTSTGEVLGEVDIKRGIFQGDSLSPLLFVLAMVPLAMLLKRETIGYRFGSGQRMINHLLFMGDLKLY